MTIKKTIKKTVVKAPEGAAAPAPAGGAAIADRLKLAPAPAPAKSGSSKEMLYALIAACLAFLASAVLTYLLYQHWDFLMPA